MNKYGRQTNKHLLMSPCWLPGERPALDFLGGVTSLVVLASENEAVLDEAGVWQASERENKCLQKSKRRQSEESNQSGKTSTALLKA